MRVRQERPALARSHLRQAEAVNELADRHNWRRGRNAVAVAWDRTNARARASGSGCAGRARRRCYGRRFRRLLMSVLASGAATIAVAVRTALAPMLAHGRPFRAGCRDRHGTPLAAPRAGTQYEQRGQPPTVATDSIQGRYCGVGMHEQRFSVTIKIIRKRPCASHHVGASVVRQASSRTVLVFRENCRCVPLWRRRTVGHSLAHRAGEEDPNKPVWLRKGFRCHWIKK